MSNMLILILDFRGLFSLIQMFDALSMTACLDSVIGDDGIMGSFG